MPNTVCSVRAVGLCAAHHAGHGWPFWLVLALACVLVACAVAVSIRYIFK